MAPSLAACLGRSPPVLAALVVAMLAVVAPPPATAALPLEPYAGYQPAAHCSPGPKPGTRALARWIVAHHGVHVSLTRRAARAQTSWYVARPS